MKSISMLLALCLAAVALAGCADTTTDDADSGDNTTTTPTATTPTTTPATNDTDGDLDPDLGEAPLVCDEPTSTPAPMGEKMGYPELVVTVEEPTEGDPCFQFVAPASASAGWTAVTLQNNGMAPHIMPMFFLAENHTFEDFLAASQTDDVPEWVVPVGGVGIATPFASGTTLIDLQEGTYVFACFFEGHHMQGMVRALEVTAAEGDALDAPVADITFQLQDFGYVVPENLTAGTYVAAFENIGTQPHEAPLIQLAENTTMEEFLAAIESEDPQGPPPGAGVGGVNMMLPGMTAYAIVTLEAGDYGFVCFVESPEHDGAPHIALGMVTQFSVAEAEPVA